MSSAVVVGLTGTIGGKGLAIVLTLAMKLSGLVSC